MQGAALGNMAAAQKNNQNQSNAVNGLSVAEPPKTITGALARADSLNERLHQVRGQLQGLADMIGGPRPCGVGEALKDASVPSAVVYRLNESVDQAHVTLSDIESLLSSIGRALG